jgi:MFS family permease
MTGTVARDDASLGVFGRRDFRLYCGATFLSTLANQILSVAVAWQVYALTHSALALGYVGLVQFLPMMACVFVAGDLADRYDRRIILTASYFAYAIGAALFLTLTLFEVSAIRPFYAVLALFGAARSFGQPAGQSFLPALVADEQFPEAVAWTSSARQTAVIAGPALGGAIYLIGPAAAYGICLIAFLAVTAAIAAVHTRSNFVISAREGSTFQRLAAGVVYMREQPIILGAITLDLFAVLLGGATALLPVYARDILRIGPTGLGLLRSAPALGAAVTGLILGRLPLRRRVGLVMFACVAIFGVATIAFGLSRSFGLSIAALIVLGASDMVSVYVRSTLVQLATPDSMRGRVSAVNSLFIGASNELGEFESGITAAWFGTVPSVVIGGMGTLAVVGAFMALFPQLRDVDRMPDVTLPG